MLNLYCIIELPNPNMIKIYDVVVGDQTGQRTSLDGTKVMVKLPLGDLGETGILTNEIKITHVQAKAELRKPEWTDYSVLE